MATESFGPWGPVVHGPPTTYDIPRIFACYKVGVGNDYTTVPTNHPLKDVSPKDAVGVYYTLAHMAGCHMPLFFEDKRRIDDVWTAEHKQALADYHAALPRMNRRYLQENGRAVLWHDARGRHATIFPFAAQKAVLPGTVVDLTTGQALPSAAVYTLEARHTYGVKAAKLPRALG
jgi:hypothetical protein